MLVLALDSAGSACSAALWRDGVVLARRFAVMTRGQSEALMPMVRDVLAEAGVAVDHVDLLAATVGPGAFTGIRIGLAAARGLALAAGKPLAGIATTEAAAAAVPAGCHPGRDRLVVMDSRRDELWVQEFAGDLTPRGPIRALTPCEAAAQATGPVVVAGDGAVLVLPLLADGVAAPGDGHVDAVQVAALAARHWPGGTLPPQPLYLRPADVTMARA